MKHEGDSHTNYKEVGGGLWKICQEPEKETDGDEHPRKN